MAYGGERVFAGTGTLLGKINNQSGAYDNRQADNKKQNKRGHNSDSITAVSRRNHQI